MNIALYVVLGLSVLLDLALGAWASAAWGSFVREWHLNFNDLTADAYNDTRLLGLVLGFCLFFFAAIQLLAMYWIRSEKEEGHRLTIVFGGYLIVSSLVTFLVFGRPEFLLLDGLRGAVLAVLATVVLRSPATVRELRLPDRSAHEEPRRRHEHGREPGRAGRRGGETGRRERRLPGGGEAASNAERGRGRDRDRAIARLEERAMRGRSRSEGRQRAEARGSIGTGGAAPPRDRIRSLATGGSPIAATPPPPREPQEEARQPGTTVAEPEAAGRVEQADQARARPRRVENRPRTTEELIEQDLDASRRARSEPAGERPLTVVVRGTPESYRTHSIGDVEAPPESATVSMQAEEPSMPSDRRHRRRRRRSRGDRSGVESAPSAETPLPQQIGAPFEPERPDVEGPETPHVPQSQPESKPEGRGARSSSFVEALDMLSLLDPASRKTGPERPFGRTRKPVVRRRPVSRSMETGEPLSSEESSSEIGPVSQPPTRSAGSGPTAGTEPRSEPVKDEQRPDRSWPLDEVRESEQENPTRREEDS